jgi:hypothetical protein
VIAAIDKKIAARVGKLTFFDVLDPRSVNANGNIMFGFACYSAGMTANTFALVDDKGIFRHIGFPLVRWKRRFSLIISVREKPEFV